MKLAEASDSQGDPASLLVPFVHGRSPYWASSEAQLPSLSGTAEML